MLLVDSCFFDKPGALSSVAAACFCHFCCHALTSRHFHRKQLLQRLLQQLLQHSIETTGLTSASTFSVICSRPLGLDRPVSKTDC